MPLVSRNVLYQYQSAFLEFLNVKDYDETVRKLTVKTVLGVAQMMDNPANMYNAATEELIKFCTKVFSLND